jgi:WD40 repeat protein
MNDSHIAALTTDNQSEIAIIDLDSGKYFKHLCPEKFDIKPGMCMTVKLISETAESSRVLTGYEDGHIAFWDTTSEALLCHAVLHSDPVMCADYSRTLNKGISGSVDNTIKIWMIKDQPWTITSLQCIEVTNPGLNCVRFRDDCKLFVTGGWDHKVRVFHGKNCKTLAVLSSHMDSVQCAAFRRDNTLAVGSKDGTISLWNIYM